MATGSRSATSKRPWYAIEMGDGLASLRGAVAIRSSRGRLRFAGRECVRARTAPFPVRLATQLVDVLPPAADIPPFAEEPPVAAPVAPPVVLPKGTAPAKSAMVSFVSALAYAITPVAGVALGAAVRSASERRWAAAALGLGRGLLALGIGYCGLDPEQTAMPVLTTTVVAVVGVLVSLLGLAVTLRRPRALSRHILAADSARLIWIGVVGVDLCTCALLGGALLAILGLLGLIATPLMLMVRTWQLASGKRRWLAMAYLVAPALLVLGLPIPSVLPWGLLGVHCFVLIVPVVTLWLLPPFSPGNAVKFAAALSAFTLVPLVGFAFLHVERCAGELRATGAPKNWKALSVIAQGDGGSLGRFSLRWQQSSYKNYPAPYEDMELADGDLCFDSALSLDHWFGAPGEVLTHEPSMYRSPNDLRLHHEPQQALYVVSARAWSEGPEELIVAFRRQLGFRIRFDSLVSLTVFVLGGAALILGCHALWRRRSTWGLTLLILGAFSPIVYEATTDAFQIARPGRELRRSVRAFLPFSV